MGASGFGLILTSLSQALKHVGHELEVACDGDEGIELMDSDRWELLCRQPHSCDSSNGDRFEEELRTMTLLNRFRGKEKRSGKDRRRLDDPHYRGPLRRTGTDRRKGGRDRPTSNRQGLSGDQRKMVDRIVAFLEKQGK